MKRILKRMLLFLLPLTLLSSVVPSASAAFGDNAEQSRKVRVGWYNSERFQEGEAE